MKKVIAVALFIAIGAWGTSPALAQYTTPEFSKAGKTFRYVWAEYLDAQLFLNPNDSLLQILSIRQGKLQQKMGSMFMDQWKVLGLWHAYQNEQKNWISNGVVADLLTPILEQQQVGPAFMSVDIGAPRLAAASDSGGRLHAVITGSGQGNNGLIYAVRDDNSNWHVMASGAIPDNLAEPRGLPAADGNQITILALVQGGENSGRIAKYTFSPSLGGDRDTFRWARELFPESLRAASFAALQDNRTFYLFLQSADRSGVQAVERDVATGKWNLDPQRFEPSIPRELSRIAPQSMMGFMGKDGLPQVLALQAGGGEQVIVHIYRDEIGLWHNNGTIFNVSNFKMISASPDAQGYINLSGIGLDGRVWHGYRGDGNAWRSNGFVYDSNSR